MDPRRQPTEATAAMGFTRRRVLQVFAASGVAAFLAACGVPGTRTPTPAATRMPATSSPSAAATGSPTTATASPGESAVAEPTASEEPTPQPTRPAVTGGFVWANWIGYIDRQRGAYPTLERFTQETGLSVDYQEAVDDNDTFYTSDLEGPLSVGQPTGWDLVVLSDWMVQRLIQRGWLEQIDTSWMTNYPANLEDVYRDQTWDPGNLHAAPWQSGMTGIMYDRAQTGELSSIEALWDPQYAGRVIFLFEMRDTAALSAIRLGFDPDSLTQEQFDQAVAEVQRAADEGQVRQFAGNGYVNRLASGDAVMSMGWSGDVYLLTPDQRPDQDFQWVLPDEGGNLWTDYMVIPKGAVNKQQAEVWIDFYYQPDVAATVEAWVNYVCPVKGAGQAMVELDPALAENPLIFPTQDMVARLHDFVALDLDTAQAWEEAFNVAIGR